MVEVTGGRQRPAPKASPRTNSQAASPAVPRAARTGPGVTRPQEERARGRFIFTLFFACLLDSGQVRHRHAGDDPQSYAHADPVRAAADPAPDRQAGQDRGGGCPHPALRGMGLPFAHGLARRLAPAVRGHDRRRDGRRLPVRPRDDPQRGGLPGLLPAILPCPAVPAALRAHRALHRPAANQRTGGEGVRHVPERL